MALRIIKILIIISLIISAIIFYLYWNKPKESQNVTINKEEKTGELIISKEDESELEEKIGQMLLVGFRGTEVDSDSYIAKVLKEVKAGGVVLFDFDVPSKSFPRNIINPEQTKNLISNLKKLAPFPIFVAIDVEGGKVNRLKKDYGFISVPSPAEMGEKGDYKQTEKVAESVSLELSHLGFNLNFAPVVDVNINPKNPIIGAIGRSFSDDPKEVVQHAKAFIEGLRKNNIISTIKHFPGHGSSAEDSHLGLVDITKTYNDQEILPFKELIKMGIVDAVMTAHVVNQKIDPDYPATLSSKFLQEILRKEIGFRGIIISDDMQMGAIVDNFGFEKAIIQAINAGCDLLIISNNGRDYDEKIPYKARDIILEAVKNGLIKEERIDESFQRIMELKKGYGITN